MNVDAWKARQIHKRFLAYMERREQDFILEHGQDTDAELIAYVRRKATEFRRMPHPLELPGGGYLQERLGDWRSLAVSLGYMPAGERNGQLAKKRIRQLVENAFYEERRSIKAAKAQAGVKKCRSPAQSEIK